MSTHFFQVSKLRSRFGVRSWRRAPAACVLAAAFVLLPACTAGGSTTSGNGNSGNGSPSATATTAPAPTATPLSAVPQITLAFCQGLVSLSDANTLMKPATPATSIVPDNARPGGSCSYIYAQGGIDLTLFFQPFPVGMSLNTIAQQSIAEAEAKGTIPPGTQYSITPVSGVGDQALFASISGTVHGITGYYDSLYTTVGSVALSCFNFGLGSPTTPQQPALTQVCTQAVSRL